MAKKYVVKVIEETTRIMVIREVDSHVYEDRYDNFGRLVVKSIIGDTKTVVVEPYRELTEMEKNILCTPGSSN